MCVTACIHTYMNIVPLETGRGCQIPCTQNYRWLWDAWRGCWKLNSGPVQKWYIVLYCWATQLWEEAPFPPHARMLIALILYRSCADHLSRCEFLSTMKTLFHSSPALLWLLTSSCLICDKTLEKNNSMAKTFILTPVFNGFIPLSDGSISFRLEVRQIMMMRTCSPYGWLEVERTKSQRCT